MSYNNPARYVVKDDDIEIITNVERYEETYESENFIGIRIITNKQTMHFLIDNYQTCCETYDVILHNCNFYDLINDEVKIVRWADEDEFRSNDNWGHNTAIIYLETNNKDVFIEIFNDHNGYYPHSYKVNWGDYSDTDRL